MDEPSEIPAQATSTGRRRGGRGGRRRTLTVERIVDAAIAVAERDGLDRLSMPRLASELGCGVMTLYGYAKDKDELLGLMTARMIELMPQRPAPDGDWADHLRAHAVALRDQMVAHRALTELFVTHRFWSRRVAESVESLLTVLTAAGWPLAEAVRAYRSAHTYTLGFVTYELQRTRPHEEYRRWWRHALADLPAEEFPLVHAAGELMPQGALEPQFQWGLERVLDGLRTEFAALAGGPSDG
ncbi:TetR/AcrR family transcriptional regulator C-terminal domain-containing protein [Actinomadura rayongensis]|uniref:TetR family transcriptional regulator n=1 Tax=Actinomadura rayongensis TaxID=1429076 RepID=A0A6I4WMF7_9ACTN|nr:TetR family transcriptional regulator [Actinomadura rayongensis]